MPKSSGKKKSSPKPAKRSKTPKRHTPAALKAKPRKNPASKKTASRADRRYDVRAKSPRVREAKVTIAAPTVSRIATPAPAAPAVLAIELPYELVAQRAYEIWEERVRRAYDSHANWLEAEADLRVRLQSAATGIIARASDN